MKRDWKFLRHLYIYIFMCIKNFVDLYWKFEVFNIHQQIIMCEKCLICYFFQRRVHLKVIVTKHAWKMDSMFRNEWFEGERKIAWKPTKIVVRRWRVEVIYWLISMWNTWNLHLYWIWLKKAFEEVQEQPYNLKQRDVTRCFVCQECCLNAMKESPMTP